MTVKLNGIAIVQPATLQEDVLPIATDVTALDGSMQRNQFNTKYQAKMHFDKLTVSGYQQILAIINAGRQVSYYNDSSAIQNSTLTYSGLPTWQNQPYVDGASFWQDLDLTIRQV